MSARLLNVPGGAGAARSLLLTNWVTIRGNSSVLSVTQDADEWLDAPGCADMTFWVEVSEVTVPAGATAGVVLLYLETAPTRDEALFRTVAGPIVCTAGGTPITPVIAKTASGGITPLCRYVRWRVVATVAASWDVTLRVRAVGNRSAYFAPTQLGGCSLWLRSDLGVTLGGSSGNTVQSWGDLSGLNNGASLGSAGPTYNAAGGVNGWPRISVASGQYMTGPLTPNVSNHTLFVVLGYPSPLNNYATMAGTNSSFAVNSGFAQFTETPTGIIGRTSTGAIFSAVTTDTSSLGAVSIYSTAADSSSVDLYINGTSKASTSTGASLVACPNYVLFGLNAPTPSYNFVGDAYEFILFNSVLSAVSRRLVHRYLGARYGIAVP